MPVFLLHGFRWPRGAIRIHIILQNLDDAAAEWLVAPATTSAMLNNFQEIYPECMAHLPELRFVEQYDPNDTSPGAGSQPYAYVADVCQEIKLGIDIEEVRGRGVPNDQWSAMMELRDRLAQNEKVAWYVVVCGDEDRWAPGLSTPSDSMPQDVSTGASQNEDESDASDIHSSVDEDAPPDVEPPNEEEQPKGFRKFLSTISKRKSRTNLESSKSTETMNTIVRDPLPTDSKKYTPSVAGSSHSSGKKSRGPSPDEVKQKPVVPEARAPVQRISMPRLQANEPRGPPGANPTLAPPSGLSLIPDEDDEDREVITGPSLEDEDDLAAPAPTIKHGKQQDLISKQRKRSSIASFTSAVRGTSPETMRNIGPLVRAHPQPQHNPPVELHQPRQLQQELLPNEIDEQPRKPKTISPPASYVPTGTPTGVASIRSSRSSSPVKVQGSQRSNSRLSALAALEGQPQVDSSPRRSTRGGRSRKSSVQSGLNARSSQYSMSSMSNALAQMYSAHEREFKNRQSVTQEDLVARGLENMDFSALR